MSDHTPAEPTTTVAGSGACWDPLPVALVLTDSSGVITQWGMEAQELLGYAADEVVGRDGAELVPPAGRAAVRGLQEAVASGHSVTGSLPMAHKDGSTVELEIWACPMAEHSGGRCGVLGLAIDARRAQRARGAVRPPETLFELSPIGLAVFDTELRFRQVNPALEVMDGIPATAHVGRQLADVLPETNVTQTEAAMRRVLATGDPAVNFRRIGRTPADPGHDHIWTCSYFRLEDAAGGPLGISASVIDVTTHEQERQNGSAGRERLELINEATLRVGSTLDVARTGQELADIAVPRLADAATVDVLTCVTRTSEPLVSLSGGAAMRRLGKAPAHGSPVADALAPVDRILYFPAVAPYAQALTERRPFLLPRVDARTIAPAARHTSTPERIWKLGVHSMMMVPLIARGLVLGVATFLRADDDRPFDTADLTLAGDLAAHAAICIDNARLYNREHDTALTLQRSMLPQRLRAPAGIEIAHCYQPASDVNEVGGDWYDVAALAPGEAALVIGDVMGHGIRAAAVMGQLRTTVRALARLDLPPGRVLHHLDTSLLEMDDPLTATCLYGICDAAAGSCRLARAGHPPPALITPEGHAHLLHLPPGAPLGIGGITYTTTALPLAPGSTLVFYTDGLVEARGHDLDERLAELTRLLTGTHRHPPAELCDLLVRRLAPAPAEDDIAILVARVGEPLG